MRTSSPQSSPFSLACSTGLRSGECGGGNHSAAPRASIGHRLFGDAKVDELAQHLATFQFDVTLVDIFELDVA